MPRVTPATAATQPITLWGRRGWGSAIVEALLAHAGQDYAFVDAGDFDRPGPDRDRLVALNPLAQVPTLVLPEGTVLTETAAITLTLADHAPGLAPPQGTADRARFFRLLIWLVANVYPSFTYGDYPERWVETAPAELVASTDRYRETLYLWLEGEISGPFVLGAEPCALDLFLAVMVSWRPRLRWFERNTPKLAAAALAARRLPGIRPVMDRNGVT